MQPMRPLGSGLDNDAYEADGMVVRIRRENPGSVVREASLLRVLAEVSPLPVPVPVAVDPGRGAMAYRKLPGVPLLDLAHPAGGAPLPDPAHPTGGGPGALGPAYDLPGAPAGSVPSPAAVGAALGCLLAALHAVPIERVADLVEVDDTPPGAYLDEAAAIWPQVSAYLPASLLPARAPVPAREAVFSHMDLGIEHVLVDASTQAITGIIDWTDAAVGDPAYDLGLILRDLGHAALDAALRALGRADAGLRERADFYARCALVEDLAYGLSHRRHAYVTKSVAAASGLLSG